MVIKKAVRWVRYGGKPNVQARHLIYVLWQTEA